MTQLLVRLFVKNAQDVKEPAVHARYGKLAGWVGIVCNSLLAVGKLLAGLFSGSIAITADAVNNFSDAASSVITLLGFKMAAKPADKEHPYGHARVEYIAGLAVAVMVMVIGVELGKSSLEKILHPAPVDYSWPALLVLVAAIVLKGWMARFNRTIGRRIGSVSLQATYVDSRNDVITTTALLAAALLARATGLALDGWMGAAVAVFILVSGVGLVRDTLDPLLGEAPDEGLVRMLDEKISAYPGVLGTHDLIVHDYGPQRRFASAHVEMDSAEDVMKSHDIIDAIERDVRENDHIHLIIHYDPVVTGEAARHTARGLAEEVVRALDPRFSLHDFRQEEAGGQVQVVFDLTVPADTAATDEQLHRQVQAALQPRYEKPVQVRMTVDRSYAAIPR